MTTRQTHLCTSLLLVLALYTPLSFSAQTTESLLGQPASSSSPEEDGRVQVEYVMDGHAPNDLVREVCERVGLNPDHGLGGIEPCATYQTIDDFYAVDVIRYFSPQGIVPIRGTRPPYSAEHLAVHVYDRGGRDAVSKYHAAMDRRRRMFEQRQAAHLVTDALAECHDDCPLQRVQGHTRTKEDGLLCRHSPF